MFTGIIEAQGAIKTVTPRQDVWDVTVAVNADFLNGVSIGDSIAVNGICLTVVMVRDASFVVNVVESTRTQTAIKFLRPGVIVNLEKALAASGRLDGHIVQGHADGTGEIRAIRRKSESYVVEIAVDRDIMACVVPKGSIAVDGISLTVQTVANDVFAVAVIPHTFEQTTLSQKRSGEYVNIETDILGKYVLAHMKNGGLIPNRLSKEMLRQNGF